MDELQRKSVDEPSAYLEKLSLYLDKKTLKKVGREPCTS